MFIVSRPIRCEMRQQKVTDKPQDELVTTWQETMSWLFLPREIFNFSNTVSDPVYSIQHRFSVRYRSYILFCLNISWNGKRTISVADPDLELRGVRVLFCLPYRAFLPFVIFFLFFFTQNKGRRIEICWNWPMTVGKLYTGIAANTITA